MRIKRCKKTLKKNNLKKIKKYSTKKHFGGEQDLEAKRLENIMINLLFALEFDNDRCNEICDIIEQKILSGIVIDYLNIMEFINFSFSLEQDLKIMCNVPQIFDFEKSPTRIINGLGRIPTENEKDEFVSQIKSYSTIDFTKLVDLMSIIGFPTKEQDWITTRLELIHNTADGPITINKVIRKLKLMIQTITTEARSSFIEIISVYDLYESFK